MVMRFDLPKSLTTNPLLLALCLVCLFLLRRKEKEKSFVKSVCLNYIAEF